MEHERRRVQRFQFIAPAELVEEVSGTRMNSWVADLGSQGCRLSVSNPPRPGTVVQLKIGTNPRETFQAQAVVVHTNGGHVGLMFNEVKPASSVVLHTWLGAAKFPKSSV
jgi:PilZ domain